MGLCLNPTHLEDASAHARGRQIPAPLCDSVALGMSLDSHPHFPRYEAEIILRSTLKDIKML